MDVVQTPKIYVSFVHDIESPGIENQFVEDVDVVSLAFCNAYETRDAATQVHQCVQLDCSLVCSKACPGKKRKTQIDCCRVESVCCLPQGYSEILACIQSSGDAYQNVSEVSIDAPVSSFVGICQSASGDLASYAGMVKLGTHGAQTGLDIPKTLLVRQLCEGHAEELVQTGEFSDTVIALISFHTFSKFIKR